MSDTDNSITSETFKEMVLYSLHNFETSITFTKKDGTERKMRCTLMESMLPERNTDSPQKAHSNDVQPVWDLDASAWRSFRWDSVISFNSTGVENARI